MNRLIPPKTKRNTTIYKGLTFKDLGIIFISLIIIILLFFTNFERLLKYGLMVIILIITLSSMLKVDLDKRVYHYYLLFIKYLLRKKRINKVKISDIYDLKILDSNIVSFGDLKMIAIEVKGIDFLVLPEENQDMIIEEMKRIFRLVKRGSIYKIDRPLNFDNYIDKNLDKAVYFKKRIDLIKDKTIIDRYKRRIELLENIDNTLSYYNESREIKIESFYLLLYDKSISNLKSLSSETINILVNIGIEARVADNESLDSLYSSYYNYKGKVEDIEIDKINERWNSIDINDEKFKISSITHLPMSAPNAWLSDLFLIPNTIVKFDFSVENDKLKVYKTINKSILELRGRALEKGLSESDKIDLNKDIESLSYLLTQLKLDNEQLHLSSFLIMYKEDDLRIVENAARDNNMYLNHLYFNQYNSYLSLNPSTYINKLIEKEISFNLQTSSLSGSFPFISHLFLDPDGDYLGNNRYPVFFDIFDSWKKYHPTRTNANMTIFGKSGGGKSFYLKKEILQQLLKGTKVFILDPENEYYKLSESFMGNWIDMGGIKGGIINPFHIFPSMDEESTFNGELRSQRQFLQEFFSIVIPDLDTETKPYLNQMIKKVYDYKNINDETNFMSLKASDYPTFDELYEVIMGELTNPLVSDFDKVYIRKIRNYIEDFKDGGLYSNLWNGYTSLKIDNDFTVLNFQSLFASNNNVIANGQMILSMRFLMQEIIKNKSINDKTNIQIVVDEAHQFINPDFPVALTFMSQMTKRIRKYGGSFVVATQNIKDFIGQNENIKAKATAVLNGCQYSAIFGLNPDDINSIIDLYKSYNGGLTKKEIDSISLAKQGEVLLIIDPKTRINAKINLYYNEIKYIE